MSTVSSNADISTKYQRVASEYAKLKVQVATLKTAVINEQEKNNKLLEDLHQNETALRKLQSEKEAYEFRNAQLLRRVSALQAEVENISQNYTKKRNAFLQKSIKAEHKRAERGDDVLEMELQVKLAENENLHKKIVEMELDHTEALKAIQEKNDILASENKMLKKKLEVVHTRANEQCVVNVSPGKRVLDNGTAAAVPLNTSPAIETLHVLWLDALRIARTLTAGFANLLQLFEQRSTIYPNDINLEKLPERTLLFGRRLLSSCDMFESCSTGLEGILVKNAEEDCLDLSEECSKFSSTVSGALRSCEDWINLFIEGSLCENRLSWCTTVLCKCNEQWNFTFAHFITSLSTLARLIDTVHDRPIADVLSHIEGLPAMCLDCSSAYTAKIFIENHLPTATKRLRCVNDCISKCLASLHRNMSSFAALMQLIFNAIHPAKDEKAVEVALPPQTSFEDGTENVAEESEETEGKSTQRVSQSSAEFLKAELDSSTRQVVQLNKEKERITVEAELLKTKLQALRGCSTISKEDDILAGGDIAMIVRYYQERVGELHADIEHLRSRAKYYKCECKDLLAITKAVKDENEQLEEQLKGANAAAATFKEDLETTCKSYEKQVQDLHEHIAQLSAQLEDQTRVAIVKKNTFNGIAIKKHGSRKPFFK